MLILIDRISLRMIASASNHKLMALVAKWDFPDADPLVVDSEIGREWTALNELDMKNLYLNMSGMSADQYPGYKDAIEQLRTYASGWPEYPKPLSYFEDLEAKTQAIPGPVATEEAKAAQSMPDVEPGPFYWIHPESSSAGIVHTRAELDQMLEADPNVEHVDEDAYNAFLEEICKGPENPGSSAPEPTEVSRATHQAIIRGVEAENAKRSPAEKAEAAASAPTKPQAEKKEYPSVKAPPKTGATKRVWEIAEAYLAKMGTADVKLLRKTVVAHCESEGINGGTAATQFGKWRNTKGF